VNINLDKTNNELIKKRRKKRAVRRNIILIILLIAVSITLCLKLTYFNVDTVAIHNNNIISSEEIVENANINFGTNIFYMNLKQIKTNVLINPYIEEVAVKRLLPRTISITVKEREAKFYGEVESQYVIIDKNGVVLEKRDNVDNMNLTRLSGLDFQKTELGVLVPGVDERKQQIISTITELIGLNSSDVKIDSVNLESTVDIKMYCQNLLVKLGDGENLKQKMNKALNIIIENNLISQKGYVDVSYNGNPVIYIEKQEDKK
jgi:cell division protein FtsQ